MKIIGLEIVIVHAFQAGRTFLELERERTISRLDSLPGCSATDAVISYGSLVNPLGG